MKEPVHEARIGNEAHWYGWDIMRDVAEECYSSCFDGKEVEPYLQYQTTISPLHFLRLPNVVVLTNQLGSSTSFFIFACHSSSFLAASLFTLAVFQRMK
jgi:hypothetical protein